MKPVGKRLLAMVVATASTAGLTLAGTPAQAQRWHDPNQTQHRWHSPTRTPRQAALIRQQISGLANDINHAQRRGIISRREAQGLHRAVRNLRTRFRAYNSDGLSEREMQYLE